MSEPQTEQRDTAQPLSEAYDIKNVDFRNLLTVAVGKISNQTGESFDAAMLRSQSADEILRRYNATQAHAERLSAELVKCRDILCALNTTDSAIKLAYMTANDIPSAIKSAYHALQDFGTTNAQKGGQQ